MEKNFEQPRPKHKQVSTGQLCIDGRSVLVSKKIFPLLSTLYLNSHDSLNSPLTAEDLIYSFNTTPGNIWVRIQRIRELFVKNGLSAKDVIHDGKGHGYKLSEAAMERIKFPEIELHEPLPKKLISSKIHQ